MKKLILFCLTLLATTHIHAQTATDMSPTPRQVMLLGRGTANTVDWHPDGHMLAAGGSRGVWLYDELLADLAHFEEAGDVSQLAWSPSGDMLATFGRDGMLHVWFLTLEPYTLTPRESWSFIIESEYSASYFAWSPDSRKLAVTTKTGIQVLEIASGEVLLQLSSLSYALAWHPDGTQLAGVVDLGEEMGEQVRVWDATTGAIVNTYTSPEPNLFWSDIQWSPDGSVLVGTTVVPGTLHAWSVETGDLLSDVDTSAGELLAYHSGMWWLNDGQQLVTAVSFFPAYTFFEIWNTENWTKQDSVSPSNNALRISKKPDSAIWALLTTDCQIIMWDFEKAEILQTNSEHGQSPSILVWSSDNQHLAAARRLGRSIDIWDVTLPNQPQLQVATTSHRDLIIEELRWSADNDTVIGVLSISAINAPGMFSTAFVVKWQAQTGESLGTLHDTPGYVAHDDSGDNYLPHYIWSSDFTRAAMVLDDEPVVIYDVVTNTNGYLLPDDVIATIEMADYPALISWSPDNSMLAVIIRDPQGETSAWVYDAETGNLINQLRSTFPTTSYDVTWSPDSSMVALAGSRGVAGSGETEYRLDILKIDPSSEEAEHITTIVDTGTKLFSAWHPESHIIAVTTSSGIQFYPVERVSIGENVVPIATIPDIQSPALAWSHDGTWLAGSHEDGTVRVWDVTRDN